MNVPYLLQLLLMLLAILAGGVVHEYGHAWAAARRGDPTAKERGRLTFYPAGHIDGLQTILLPILTYMMAGFPFGGMKPVPVNPARLSKADYLFAVACGPLFQVGFAAAALVLAMLITPFVHPGSYGMMFLNYCVVFNLMIAAFNMLPIPPLDGSRFMRERLPAHLREEYDSIGYGFGFMIIIVLGYTGVLRYVMEPVSNGAQDLFFDCVNHMGLHQLVGKILW
ncbi:MAG: site-2 protease family protein [Planctomycetota bacterium]